MLAQRHRRWGALLFIVFVTRHQLIVTTVFEVKMEWRKDDIFLHSRPIYQLFFNYMGKSALSLPLIPKNDLR